MLTRCPACATSFRVTPDQLKVRGGKVRCGKCQTVFNALDSLVDTPPPAAAPVTASAAVPVSTTPSATDALPLAASRPASESRPPADLATPLTAETRSVEATSETMPASAADETPLEAEPANPDAVRDAAMAAGLVAAREATEIPGYNKWAEGAFTGTVTVAPPPTRTVWPFVLAALLLLMTLAGQLAHQFRAELAVGVPSLRPLLETACAHLDCDIPLPRHAELVSIEASDLQSDPTRGSALLLTATLKNRATYAQAWPLLEITLTDTQDAAVVRRVLQPADYLPPQADPTLFPPNGEIGLRLWLEAKDVAAAGYRLYVFYP